MKQHLKTIEEVLDLFGENAFYNISFYGIELHFQGKFNPYLIKRCQQEGYTSTIDVNGYVFLEKNEIKITLTD